MARSIWQPLPAKRDTGKIGVTSGGMELERRVERLEHAVVLLVEAVVHDPAPGMGLALIPPLEELREIAAEIGRVTESPTT